jgi:DNA-binding response OmpR family regulator
MRPIPKRNTILIVDSDLGSVFWLGQTLDAGGYEALPAKNVPDAESLIAESHSLIDLLIVRTSIPGVACFVEQLRESRGDLKTIGLLDENEGPSSLELQVEGWLVKPLLTTEMAKLEYLELIGEVLAENC